MYCRLADAGQHPCGHHLRKARQHAEGRRGAAPQRRREHQQRDTVVAIRQPATQQAADRVRQGERDAGQDADLGIREAEGCLDRFDIQAEAYPMDEGDREDERENAGTGPCDAG